MRVLIDECLPWKFGRLLTGHDCVGVVKAGLTGKSNGVLLRSAEAADFDVLITVDQKARTSAFARSGLDGRLAHDQAGPSDTSGLAS